MGPFCSVYLHSGCRAALQKASQCLLGSWIHQQPPAPGHSWGEPEKGKHLFLVAQWQLKKSCVLEGVQKLPLHTFPYLDTFLLGKGSRETPQSHLFSFSNAPAHQDSCGGSSEPRLPPQKPRGEVMTLSPTQKCACLTCAFS